jgi:hypothetical protein
LNSGALKIAVSDMILRHTLDELAAEGRLARLTLARLGRDETMALVRRLGRADRRSARNRSGRRAAATRSS